MKFTADRAGEITELRYYRSASDAGDTDVREGHLWALRRRAARDRDLHFGAGAIRLAGAESRHSRRDPTRHRIHRVLPDERTTTLPTNGFFAPSNEVAFDGIDDDAFTDAFGVLSAPQNP